MLNASGGGRLAELLRCLGRPHEHGDIDTLQFFLQAVDLAQGHGVPDMPEVLTERRQKPEGHRQRDGKAPGRPQPLQSGHELADTGSGNDVSPAGNAGKDQNEIGHCGKDRGKRARQQRQQPELYCHDDQIDRQQAHQHLSLPLQQEQAEVGQHHGDAEHRRSPGEHHHIGQQPNQDFGPWVQKGTAGSRRPHCASPALTKCLRMSFMPSRAPRMEPARILSTMIPNTGQVSRPSMVAI